MDEAAPTVDDDYEAWLRAEKGARRWGRLTVAVLLVFGHWAAYRTYARLAEEARLALPSFMPPPKGLDEDGLYAGALTLAAAVLLSLSGGRLVKELVLWRTSTKRPWMGRLVAGSLVLAAVAALGVYLCFDMRPVLPEYGRVSKSEPGLELFLIALAGSGCFYLFTKSGERASDSLEEGDARQKSGPDVGRRLSFAAVAVLVLVAASFGAAYGFDWRGILPVGAGILASLVSWWVLEPRASRQPDRTAARTEVAAELTAIRNATARIFIGRVAALAAGVGTTLLGLYAFGVVAERSNRHAGYDDRMVLGFNHWFMVVAAGVVVGLFVNKVLAPPSEDSEPTIKGDVGGVFDETLAQTGSLEVRQQISLASLLFGGATKARYQIIDGGGAFCGYAAEQTGLLPRLFLGGQRPIDLAVDDLGRTALTVRRPFLWVPWLPFLNRATVSEGSRQVGHVAQKLSIVRRYGLLDARGVEAFDLQSGILFRGRFRILRGGAPIGELYRVRPPWYKRIFTPAWLKQADRFSLSLPPGTSLDERRLLVSALFLVDITHYPTQAAFRTGALLVAALTLFAFAFGGS